MASGHRAGRQGEVLLLQTRAGGRRVAETASGAASAGACGSSTSASPAIPRDTITSRGTLTGTRGILTGRGTIRGTRDSITGACRAAAPAGGVGVQGLRSEV